MAQLSGEKTMRPKIRLFSRVDWFFVISIVIMLTVLFSVPFWNINNRALFQMTQKKYEKAENSWRKALGKQPFSPLYRMNLAFNYMLWENPEKAIQEYTFTRKLMSTKNFSYRIKEDEKSKQKRIFLSGNGFSNSNLKEKTFFNSAISAVTTGNIDKALNFYQQALYLNPESLKTKTNIELLITSNLSKNENADRKEEKKDKSEGAEQKPENQDNQNEKGESEENNNKQKESKESEQQEQNQDHQGEREEEQKKRNQSQQEQQEQNQGHQGEREEEQKKRNQSSQNGGEQGNQEKAEHKGNPFNKNSKREYGNFKAGNRSNQKLNQKQTEVILKAILEQEKNIRERQQRERKRHPVVEKDW